MSAQVDRLNPLTGQVASSVPAMSVAEALAVAGRASAAFAQWSITGPGERRALLMAAAAALEASKEEFTAAMTAETGATVDWALFNLFLAAGMMRESAALTTQISGEVIPSDRPGCFAMALREPVGVILGIAPWNAPIILGVRAIAVALACGNCVILKASEVCPRTHGLIIDAFTRAGFPPGVVGLVTNRVADAPTIVAELIAHPAVRRINFTGSTRVGRIIAAQAAAHLKPCLLELGGKAPLLVLEDADLDEAVRAAAFGAFMNQGQICMSTERIIVCEAIADDFIQRFARKASTLAVGDPRERKAPLGAVFDLSASQHVNSLIEDATSKGARVLCGGRTDGVLMPATAIDGVTKEMRLYAEESFGPVVGIIRARDENDAVRIANDTEYGLSAAVFTRDLARGLRIARQIRSGMCHINGPTVHDEPQMPFGGVGASGYGRFGGRAGIAEFTELRWVTLQTTPGHFPF